MRRTLIALAICVIAVIGCGENSLQSEIEVRANTVDTFPQEVGSFRIAVPVPKIVAANVARVEYVITAPDMNVLRGDLRISDDVARGVARNVPAGRDRLVTLNAWNAEEVVSYSGSVTTDVRAGEMERVNIPMYPTLPTGGIEINGWFETVVTGTTPGETGTTPGETGTTPGETGTTPGETGTTPGETGTTPGGTITVELPGGATMRMVWIEPGTFTMGSPISDPYRLPAEGPQHEVYLSSGFYLGAHEVTQGQWESVMETTPWAGEVWVESNALHPAVYVSWHDVQSFIQRLNAAAGDSLYRLPTEAEWEYSARAGTTTRWSFGDDVSQLGDYAWYYDNAYDAGLRYGQPVGTKLPNPWGLYDMHGNVHEWCQDWYGSYSSEDQIDPQGPILSLFRVSRGGYFAIFAGVLRSANREGRDGPDLGGYATGFRLLRIK